jgi:voltage-gated sodium channel
MTTLVVYFYAMIGWLLFHDEDPKHWGTIGESMLTLFTVSTLEGWNDILYRSQKIQPLAWIFFVSFVLLISFLIINIVMGIMMNSIERARETAEEEDRGAMGEGSRLQARLDKVRGTLARLELERARETEHAGPEGESQLDLQIEALHHALLELEAEIARQSGGREQEDLPKIIGRRAGRAM